ncbi:MAG: hypothetical protein KDA88_00570 [Planctomycetaceae bacterium]|nr:hypothetical protein [Planctomycetaceae bacterium]MCB9951492.1 hypothetical protein [Planctomycetaceae bacterium]
MSIEFTCLNCRHRMVADPADVGERVECPECGQTLKVPAPVGGKLTQKRMPRQDVPPLLDPNYQGKPSITAPNQQASELVSQKPAKSSRPRKFEVPQEPANGFELDFDFDCILGRDEEDYAHDFMEDVIDRMIEHFEKHPQHFSSCGLLLKVFKYAIDEVVIQVLGSVNGEAIRFDARVNLEPHDRSGSIFHRHSLVGMIMAGTAEVTRVWKTSQIGSRTLKPMLKQVKRGLDDHAGVPRSWWSFW